MGSLEELGRGFAEVQQAPQLGTRLGLETGSVARLAARRFHLVQASLVVLAVQRATVRASARTRARAASAVACAVRDADARPGSVSGAAA